MNLIHRDYPVTIDGVTVTLRSVPMVDRADADCLAPGDSDAVNRLLALALLRAGSHGAEAFRRTRYVLRLKPPAAAELLGVSPDAVAAWESGEAPVDRSALAVLASILREQVGDPMTTREHLAAMAAPTLAAVSIDWPATDAPASLATG